MERWRKKRRSGEREREREREKKKKKKKPLWNDCAVTVSSRSPRKQKNE